MSEPNLKRFKYRFQLIIFLVAALLILNQSAALSQSTPPGGTVEDKTGLSPYEIGCRIMGVCSPPPPPVPGNPPPAPTAPPPTPTPTPPPPVANPCADGSNTPISHKVTAAGSNVPSSYVPTIKFYTVLPGPVLSKHKDAGGWSLYIGSALTDEWGDQSTDSYGQGPGWVVVCGDGSPSPSPGPSPGPSPSPSPGPSPSPSPGPSPDPGGGGASPPSGGNGSTGGGGGNGSTGGGDGKGQNPDKPEEYKSRKPNFIAYAYGLLRNKFPFDIVGDTALPPGASTCPKFTFFAKDFELCIVLDFIRLLKIPVIISFVIWSIQSL